MIFVLADAPGGGGRFCGGGDGAVLHSARICRGEEEEAARHPAGSYGQIFPSPHTQTGRLHTTFIFSNQDFFFLLTDSHSKLIKQEVNIQLLCN